jgi:hypothetical protein
MFLHFILYKQKQHSSLKLEIQETTYKLQFCIKFLTNVAQKLLSTWDLFPNPYVTWLDVANTSLYKLSHLVKFEFCYVIIEFSSILSTISMCVQLQNVNLSHINHYITCKIAN